MAHPIRADVAVIGLGGIGSAAFRQLAVRGMRVVGVEQFSVAHDRGSSHGETRLFRARHAQVHRQELAMAAMTGWNELQSEVEEPLVRWTGQLWVGDPDTGRAAGFEPLGAHDVSSLGFELRRDDVQGFWDPTGGVLAVERCVAAQCRLGHLHGGVVLENTRTLRIETLDGAFRIQTEGGDVLVEQVVLTAGAWTRQFMPLLGLSVHRVPQVWFHRSGAFGDVPFVFDLPSGDFYGAGWNGDTVKVGGPRHSVLEDPMRRGDDVEDENIARVSAFVREHVPALRPAALRSKWCMSTASVDEEFIVDRAAPGLIVAAGLSGRGFKYATALGSLLADIVLGADPPAQYSIGRLDIPRLARVHPSS